PATTTVTVSWGAFEAGIDIDPACHRRHATVVEAEHHVVARRNAVAARWDPHRVALVFAGIRYSIQRDVALVLIETMRRRTRPHEAEARGTVEHPNADVDPVAGLGLRRRVQDLGPYTRGAVRSEQ